MEFTIAGRSYRFARMTLCNLGQITMEIVNVFRSAPTITWTFEITEDGIEILANGEVPS